MFSLICLLSTAASNARLTSATAILKLLQRQSSVGGLARQRAVMVTSWTWTGTGTGTSFITSFSPHAAETRPSIRVNAARNSHLLLRNGARVGASGPGNCSKWGGGRRASRRPLGSPRVLLAYG